MSAVLGIASVSSCQRLNNCNSRRQDKRIFTFSDWSIFTYKNLPFWLQNKPSPLPYSFIFSALSKLRSPGISISVANCKDWLCLSLDSSDLDVCKYVFDRPKWAIKGSCIVSFFRITVCFEEHSADYAGSTQCFV